MEFNHAILKKVLHGISETDGNSCFGDIGFEKTKMAIVQNCCQVFRKLGPRTYLVKQFNMST
jgi:hypothetical protein